MNDDAKRLRDSICTDIDSVIRDINNVIIEFDAYKCLGSQSWVQKLNLLTAELKGAKIVISKLD